MFGDSEVSTTFAAAILETMFLQYVLQDAVVSVGICT